MFTPPLSPTDHDVLSAVRDGWLPVAENAAYLPVGFGAHHWRIDQDSVPALFATLDVPGGHRTADLFEGAYAAASELAARGFLWVLAPVRSTNGSFTIPLAEGILSVTPWATGRTPDEAEAARPDHTAKMRRLLAELHSTPAPVSLPHWQPRITPDFSGQLTHAATRLWNAGPFGEDARRLIVESAESIAGWASRYAELAEKALAALDRWVPTHGEPHHANQMLTDSGLVLVDWESFALAPHERDLLDLPEHDQRALGGEPEMIELFELEWRLTEIREYARWFQAPHTGSEDDRTALADLRNELTR
ncbi:hypothetical protein GCM10009733_024280 [Nonomuraea maheshkhaliensis]|uniref:Aminoglycoside phosphotransferase domain-containing protein n=1 Tax=Nonomuraea maheshkhaliensis TaxID=419590 RepID=A0ABN2F2K8_9ACTN